jgi:hypothetical protein
VASVVKVLQRSLFNKQVHEHYGTGIASGLADERPGFAMGGRVNLQQGGDPDIAAIIAEGKALQSKDELFDGRTKITSAPGSFGFLSVLGQDYQLQLFKKIREQGLDKKTFKSLPREQQEIIAQRINDEIFNNMATKYNVSPEQLDEHFGGKMVINNALKSIETQFNYSQPALEKNMLSLEENYQNTFASLQEENPGILEPLPSIAQQQTTEDPVLTPSPSDDDDDAVMQAGLMGLDRTGDEFRQQYVDYLQQLQQETGIEDKRRREAVEAGFFNLGAADPVQEGESLVQAGIRAFRDPMAALRAQESVQAEDIYKRGADVLDQALSPSDSANVLLIQDLVEAGIPRPQAIDMVVGLTQQRSAAALEAFQDPQIRNAIDELVKGTKGTPGISQKEAIQRVIGFDLPQSAEEIINQQKQPTNIGDQTITQQGITAPTLGIKDGGRVGLQQGGEPLSEAVTQEQMGPTAINAGSPTVEAMSFEELREKLPSYISDKVVKLLSENPTALMELAQAQTDRDLKEFEDKYKVDVTMPQAESEVDYTGAV